MKESVNEMQPKIISRPHVHGKRLKENLVRVQTLSSGQKHVTIPAPLARAANIERGDVAEWRICKSTGKLELTVLKNYVPPPKEEPKPNTNDGIQHSEHGQASEIPGLRKENLL